MMMKMTDDERYDKHSIFDDTTLTSPEVISVFCCIVYVCISKWELVHRIWIHIKQRINKFKFSDVS